MISFCVQLIVDCDDPECGIAEGYTMPRVILDNLDVAGTPTPQKLRSAASRLGWILNGSTAICPRCASKDTK